MKIMEDNEIYKDLRDRFADYSEPVGDACWESIAKSLDSVQLKRKRRMLYYRISSMAAAAVLLLGVFLLREPVGTLPAENKTIAVAAADSLIEQLPVETIKDSALPLPKQIKRSRISLAENRDAVPGRETAVKLSEVAAENEDISESSDKKGENISNDGVGDDNVRDERKRENRDESADEVFSELIPDDYDEFRAEDENIGKRKRVLSSLSVNSGIGTAKSGSAGLGNIQMSAPIPPGMGVVETPSQSPESIERISEVDYAIPLNVGVQAQMQIAKGLSLGVGLNYSMLKSRYEGLLNKRYYDVNQTLHYIGVPVNLYVSLMDRKNFYLYANVGGTIEKGVRASYKLTNYEGEVRRFRENIEGVQYSINGGFGLEYRFVKRFGIYLEPNVAYYFDSDIPASIRTAQPLQVKVDIGLRFHLN